MAEPRVSRVEQAADTIALRIVSGGYPVGSLLPSVRGLAAELGINPSTVQVVLARLQALGFVETRVGLGLIVRDHHLYGGIETCRYIFRFAQRLPEQATEMFADVLAARLTVVRQAVTAIVADPRRYDPAPVRRSVEQLALLAVATPDDAAALARAEIHALRLLIAATENRVDLAVFNSISEILLGVPVVLQALYTDTPLHVLVWNAFLTAWESGSLDPAALEVLASGIGVRDRTVVERFRTSLSPSTATRPA
jgi:GntR family transcriptional regulator, transcriptional repressor for pyruvate dehydrogenase complex